MCFQKRLTDDLEETQDSLRTMTMRAIECEMDAVNEFHNEQMEAIAKSTMSIDSLDGVHSAPATTGNSPIPPPVRKNNSDRSADSSPPGSAVATAILERRKQSLVTIQQTQRDTDLKTLQLLSSMHKELAKKDVQISQLKNCLNQMQPRLSSYGQV